ncbi:Putative heavy-metal-binding protein [uncultured archaeon]|nr:Putative heavy-metal-binding protein [uncultured archaeon]
MAKKELIVVTTNYVPGMKITKMVGPTFGLVVRSRGIGGNFMAGLRSLVGGEIHEYTKMLSDAREDAIERLEANAKGMGANAVIGMSFDSADLGDIMTEIVAYGTAVVVEKDAKASNSVSLR